MGCAPTAGLGCAAPCRDPIERVRKLILSLEIGVEAADLKKIEKTIKKEVDGVVEQSKVGRPPRPMLWRLPSPTRCLRWRDCQVDALPGADGAPGAGQADPYPPRDFLTRNIYKDMLRSSFRGVDKESIFEA